jgi:hypothetical protein
MKSFGTVLLRLLLTAAQHAGCGHGIFRRSLCRRRQPATTAPQQLLAIYVHPFTRSHQVTGILFRGADAGQVRFNQST